MSRDFYKDEETENKINYDGEVKTNGKNNNSEKGQIRGKISINEIIDKNKIFIAIGIVSFLLLVILLFNGGKKQKKEESYTLGAPGQIQVDVKKDNSGENSEIEELTEEEKKELEKISIGNFQSENGQEGMITSGSNSSNEESDMYYGDDIYQNSGGFQSINNSTTNNIEAEDEQNKKERKKSSIFFRRNEIESSSENINKNEILTGETHQTGNIQNFVDNDQNKQESKRQFLEKKRSGNFYSNNFVTPSFSKYEVKTGTLIPGILVTEINSDLPGNILGQVSSNIYSSNGKYILIPMGTKIVGRYDSSLVYGQNRVLIVWERLIFPDRSTLELDNLPGTDLLGRAGMSGKVNYHGWKLLRSVVLSSILGATTSGLGNVQLKADNKGNRSVSIGGTAAEEAKDSLNQAVSSLIDRDLNRQPTVKIKQGSRFNIFVTRDMIITPYKKR